MSGRDCITDVPGVRVGHCTVADPGRGICTGVTAIIPPGDNLFRQKLPAAAQVFNGFGKSAGLVQLAELGNLETPLLLTNTLAVGVAHTALTRHMLALAPEIGRSTGTVNPLVLECNDGEINDIRALAVTEGHVAGALAAAGQRFAQGGVGAGAGMVCFGLKGGIGSAAIKVRAGEDCYTLGCLVLSNFGSLKDFTPRGARLGPALVQRLAALQGLEGGPAATGHGAPPVPEKGSIIVVLATDAPLSSRQLGRVARRAGVGIARTGSFMGGGSGEIALAFSTANPVPHETTGPRTVTLLHENHLDAFFAAAADSVETAILRSMFHGGATRCYNGKTVYAIRDLCPDFTPERGADAHE